MTATLEFSSYQFEGRDELCLIAGAQHSQTILLIPPLFDEMNRMRRMMIDVMRLLDSKNIGSVLPDLPGTNESLFPADLTSLAIWRNALLACLTQYSSTLSIAAFRGGCLIDSFADDVRTWRFSPVKGQVLLRTMMRTRIASDKEAGLSTDMAQITAEARGGSVNLAGNSIGSALFSELEEATPTSLENVHTVQLESSTRAADAKLPGSALWLRAEPGEDLLLSGVIADSLAAWVSE